MFEGIRNKMFGSEAGVRASAAGVGADVSQKSKPLLPLEERVRDFGTLHWNDLKSAYITYHQIVWDALLKYGGVLWTQWNNQTKMFDIVETEDEWTPTPEINRFAPAIDAMSSNFNQTPEVEAIPGDVNADPMVYAISDIASKLAQWVVKDNALHSDYKGDEDKAGRAGSLLTLAGTVFTITTPDSKKVGDRPVTATVQCVDVRCPQCDTFNQIPSEQVETLGGPMALAACPQCGGQTQVTPGQQVQPTGETEPVIRHRVRVDIGNPLYCLPRPGSKFMADSGYALWAERMWIEDVHNRWGIDAEPDQEYVDGYATSYENMLQYFYTGSSSSTVRTKEECMVVQMWIEPGRVKDIPEGCYAIRVNGEWKKVEPWSYVEHPLTKANYKNMPTLFFGRTDAFDLSKIQKETNHYEAIIKLQAMTASCEPILQDENTQVDEIRNRGDRVIKYRSLGPGSQPPKRLEHGTLDQGVYAQRDKLASEFQNISGAVNVWRGEAPGSITAASAISQLRGQAEQMFSSPESHWQALWKETVRKGVKICQSTMEPWEIAEIVGKGKDLEIDAFKKCNLDDTLEFISTQHGLPRTRDERRQEMITLFDKKMIDPSDVNVRQKIHDLFGETGMMQQFSLDATRARTENELIKVGQLAQPAPMIGIEDLAVHAEIHKQAVKALDFDKWDPQAKETLIRHTMDTVEAMEMMQEGFPPSPPTAGRPQNQAPGVGSGGPGAGPGSQRQPGGEGGGGNDRGTPNRGRKAQPSLTGSGGRTQPVQSANNGRPQTPTGPNGPGSMQIPGGNR